MNFFLISLLLCVVPFALGRKKAELVTPDLVAEPTDKKFYDSKTYFSEKQTKVKSFEMAVRSLKKMLEKVESALVSEGPANKVNGVYFRILPQDKFWMPACHEVGFKLHVVETVEGIGGAPAFEALFMQKWFDHSKNSTFRLPAFTTIGLGAVVVNEEGEYLLFDQNPNFVGGVRTPTDGGKLLAGKPLLPFETIESGIKRILEEKTDIDSKHFDFHGILEIKHEPTQGLARRGKGDMFIYSILTCKKDLPKKTETSEINYSWVQGSTITKKDLKTTGNFKAFEASQVFLQKYRKELEETENKLKLYRVDDKIAASLTHVFYPNQQFIEDQTKSEVKEVVKSVASETTDAE